MLRPLAYGPRRLLRKVALATALAAMPLSAALAQQQITIAALGDSLTQGYGLPEEDGFVPQLRDWLAEHGAGDVEVVNAGVSGDTSAGGLARIAWTLGDDVDGLIVALGGNDLLRGIEPAVTRSNLDGILRASDAAGVPVLLSGMRAPGNYGPDYKAEFDSIYPELAKKHGAILHPFFLRGLGSDEDMISVRDLMQADGLHPNRQGVARIVADIGPYVLELVERARSAD